MPKPTSLVVISVLWLLTGSSWILSGLSGLATLLAARTEMVAQGAPPPDSTQAFLGWATAALTVESVAGVTAIVFVIGLLRLRAWGRRGLEWLTVLSMVAVAMLLFKIIATGIEAGQTALVLGGLLGYIVVGGPMWIMRRHLRGRIIREATQDLGRMIGK